MFITWCSSCASIVTIQKVDRMPVSGFVQRGRHDKTHRHTRLFSFQNEHFLYFLSNIKRGTITAFWFEEWSVFDTAIMWMATSRKQWQIVNALRFLVVWTCIKSKLEHFSHVTRGTQHNKRYNCTWNMFLKDTSLHYKKQQHTHTKNWFI